MNLTSYRKRSGYGQRVRWSHNAVAAKARKRMERGEAEVPDEPNWTPINLPSPKFATVSIRCGSESISFRVMRFDEKRLMTRGKVQAASTIGKRVALVLDHVL